MTKNKQRDFPRIIYCESEPETPNLEEILKNWINDETMIEVTIEQIQATGNSLQITGLLREYQDNLEYTIMNDINKYRVAEIVRELKILGSPILPNDYLLFDFYHSRSYREWSIYKIEREYQKILILRGEIPSSKRKYLKREVLEMLNLLLDCNVIYNFKTKDLFINDIEGELNSYFRNYKKINVQCL